MVDVLREEILRLVRVFASRTEPKECVPGRDYVPVSDKNPYSGSKAACAFVVDSYRS